MTKIDAKDFIAPDGLIVGSGELLARRLVELLSSGHDLEVSMAGLRGVSSSYFNVVLHTLSEQFGPEIFSRRITFSFDSKPQREVFERSLASVRSIPA
jgi:hypothetical protein